MSRLSIERLDEIAKSANEPNAWICSRSEVIELVRGYRVGLAVESAPTVDHAPQNWTGVDGAIAFHLIDRHAENWNDAGEMMDAWRKANPCVPVGEGE